MTLTVSTVSDYVQRRLDGEPSVPLMTLCNQAGDYLVNAHPWGWLVRKPATLRITADQTRIALPDDFGRAIGEPKPVESTSFMFRWGTADKVAAERAYGSPSVFTGYISWSQGVTGNLTPYIELSYAPTVSESSTFMLAYYARWQDVTTDTETLQIPSFMEPLYLQTVLAFAQGYDEHDVGSLDERLAALMQGPLMLTAKRRDGSMQPSIGMMQGGAVQTLAQHERSPSVYGSHITAYDPT